MNSVLAGHQKPLSLGGVIGDAATIFRQRWSTFVGIMVAAIVPFFILLGIGVILGLFAVLSAGPSDPRQLVRSPAAIASLPTVLFASLGSQPAAEPGADRA
jgi:hypothetical protein